MEVPVTPNLVRKGKWVRLSKDLPLGFGNKFPIQHIKYGLLRQGYVISQGFELGMLRVLFDLPEGKELVKFHTESAKDYLLCLYP